MTLWAACHYVPNAYPWNNGVYPVSPYLNDTVFGLMRDSGLTHIQFWQWNYNDSTDRNYPTRRMLTAYWVQVVTRMKDFGLKPEFCLSLDPATAAELAQALGSDCLLYEVCKEPHLTGTGCSCTSATDYATKWNNVVDVCRPLASPGTKFGGPAVGVAASSQTYMQTWLNNCEGDFASYHAFPAGSTKAACIANATSVVTQYVNLYKNMIAAAGKSIPLLITEAQYTSAEQTGTDPNINWSWDQAFMDAWTTAFFNTCQALDVYASMIWVFMGYDNNFPIIRPPAQSYAKKPQYYSIQDYINAGSQSKLFTDLGHGVDTYIPPSFESRMASDVGSGADVIPYVEIKIQDYGRVIT
jgi:hypothetical protein